MKHGRLVLSGSLAASLCFATARAEADPAAAEALFQEGVQLSASGELSQACEKFEASESLDVAVGTLLRLADCYERTGRLASAWSRFREAASLSQAQSMPERERIASVRANALEARLAHLVVSVGPDVPPNFHIQLGDTPVPRTSWGSALPVDAGTLTLEASAPGYLPYRRPIAIPALDGAHIDVKVPPLVQDRSAAPALGFQPRTPSDRAAPAAGQKPAVDHGYAARATGVTMIVVGGLGLGTSGVLTLLAARRNDSSRDYCPESENLCSARGVQLRHEAGRLADAATLSVAVGGGLLLTGLVVYWAAPKRAFERVSVDALPDVRAGGLTLRAKAAF